MIGVSLKVFRNYVHIAGSNDGVVIKIDYDFVANI